MAFQFHLPDIGEGVIEGEIVEWKVAEGDTVTLDQPIVEVQTDKATVEIPSPRAGTIAKINFQAGEICPVGQVLVEIAEAGGTKPAAAAAREAAIKPPTAPAPAASGGNGHGPSAQVALAASAPARPEVIDATGTSRRVLATPATRRKARQLGVDIARIQGTGNHGRVTAIDVESAAQGGAPAAAPAPTPAASTALATTLARPPVKIADTGLEERIPFRGVRRAIAQNMVKSAFTATHFTYVEEIDLTDMVGFRERAKARAAERGVKLTYLPFVVKAVVASLKKWPQLNASLDESTQELVRKHYYHIGIAAQGPDGLVVTVIRDADKRSIFGIAREIKRLADAVQSGTIARDDMVGSTFTISSLGQLGGVMATPIINFPEVGILGVHKMSQRPAVINGEIVPRWLMNLSISLDHRLVDGYDGAMFIQDVKALLEDPELLFLEGV